jgi:hypothetical protein
MSRRLRNRPDKRATALDLARMCGHGTPLPSSDEPEEPVGEDWHYTEPVRNLDQPQPKEST